MELPLEHIYEKTENWYVLDGDFPWDVSEIKKDLFSLIDKKNVPVVFCDTCSANDVLALLGEEEEEFVFPISGFYHKERSVIFICIWEQYEQLLETLLHEFRHHMQHEQHVLHVGNEVYAERWIEKDATAFAKNKIEEYRRKCE